MKNSSWNNRLGALRQFATREGHTRVPLKHSETYEGISTQLGPWVSYLRRRHHISKLSQERIYSLESIPGWEWGPFPPGPPPRSSRNQNIISLRRQGLSLQAIGNIYGLSRQRVHQIIRKQEDG